MKKEGRYSWTIKITVISFFLSVAISVVTNIALENVGIAVAFLILAAVVAVGILFDIIGIAVTSATEAPFHAMGTRGIKGSKEAIKLIRNAEKVSSFCNDVIGDIVGIVSGGLVAAISVNIIKSAQSTKEMVLNIVLSGIVASATIGGKAFGKGLALTQSNKILSTAGSVIYFFKNIFRKNTRVKK